MSVDLAHDVRGTGPLLVLVHGITENRHSWDPLVDELARTHRVLRVDLRGHGESPDAESYGIADYAPDVAALVDEPPLLVGHSLGGLVVTAYAGHHDCRGVVNVDQPLQFAAFRDAARSLEPALRSDAFQPTVAAMFDAMRGTLPDDEWTRLSALRRAQQPVVLDTWQLLFENDLPEIDVAIRRLTGTIRVPYLNLLGATPPPGYPEWLAELIPGARVEAWDGLGHYPHLVEPQRFLDRVHQFEEAL